MPNSNLKDPINVLLIDDQPMIGEAVKRMLIPEIDIKFSYCSNPTQTLQVAAEFHPTVILQDLVMPEIDGLLLVKFLRAHNAVTRNIPLIVLSSKEEPIIKAKAFELGANDYLVKLPDRMELIARIRYHSKAYINYLKRQEAEALLQAENQRQAQYIQQVNKVTAAAVAVEKNEFDPQSLAPVASRSDELGQLARVFTQMVQIVKIREQELTNSNTKLSSLCDSASRFVPHEYVNFLRKNDFTELQLGDHVSKTMAIMFSDIRSFTTISEAMTPRENFAFVNAYLQRVSPEIRNHNGFIVKFLGDGMMAVFPDAADDAVLAGIDKQNQVREFNQQLIAQNQVPINVGIGIHVGHMMVGVVGEHNRMQGDAFSDNVNLTARLEGLTKFYGVSMLISEQAYDNLVDPQRYQLHFLDRAIVKGKNEPITVYEVLDGEKPEIRELKLKTQADFAQGIAYYRQADRIAQSQSYFERVLAVNPHDLTAQLYLQRVTHLVNQGVPDNWQGIWTFTEK
ncbi:MAG: adenylate/guanylate cyclase domain-containing protein [Pseudanabaena sp. ELA607]